MMGLGDTNLADVWAQSGDYAPTAVDQYIGQYSTPGYTWGSSSSGGSSFWDSLSTAIKGATSILGTRYAVPQLNAGQLIQSGPNGTTLYQGGPNSMYPNVGLPSSLGNVSPIVLLGGAAALFFLMKGH